MLLLLLPDPCPAIRAGGGVIEGEGTTTTGVASGLLEAGVDDEEGALKIRSRAAAYAASRSFIESTGAAV